MACDQQPGCWVQIQTRFTYQLLLAGELEQKAHFPASVHSPLKRGSYFLPHFTDGETEAERRRDWAQIIQPSLGAGV